MQYRYKAKDATGKTLSGTLTAETESDAVGQLRRQGLVVVGITGGRGGGAGAKEKSKSGFFSLSIGGSSTAKNARVKTQEMVVFTRQL